MPSSDDLLEQAAERCGFVLPTALAELVYNEMQGARRGVDNERTLHESIAREVLAMPAPSLGVDQEALRDFLVAVDDNTEITEKEMGDVFWRIEGNYIEEGAGPGSRFEGELLTVVQARWARGHLIAAFTKALLARYDIRERGAS